MTLHRSILALTLCPSLLLAGLLPETPVPGADPIAAGPDPHVLPSLVPEMEGSGLDLPGVPAGPGPVPQAPRFGPTQSGIAEVLGPGEPPVFPDPPPFVLYPDEGLPAFWDANEFIPMTKPFRLTCPKGSIRELALIPDRENPRDFTYVHASGSPGQVHILNSNSRTSFTFYPGETLSIYLDSPSVRKAYHVRDGSGNTETIEVFFVPSDPADRWEGVLVSR